MTGYRQSLLVLLLTILSGAAVAQNNTNSPYTRYDMDSYLNKAQVTAGRWVVLPMVYETSIRQTSLIQHPIRR